MQESLILSQNDIGVGVDSTSTVQKYFQHFSDRMIIAKFGSGGNMSSVGNSPVCLWKKNKDFLSKQKKIIRIVGIWLDVLK